LLAQRPLTGEAIKPLEKSPVDKKDVRFELKRTRWAISIQVKGPYDRGIKASFGDKQLPNDFFLLFFSWILVRPQHSITAQ